MTAALDDALAIFVNYLPALVGAFIVSLVFMTWSLYWGRRG